MDLRRPRLGDWVSGLSGLALLVSLLLPWYGAPAPVGGRRSGGDLSAWEAFSVTDVALALSAVMGVALLGLALQTRMEAVSVATAALTAGVGSIVALAALYRLIDLPADLLERRFAWLGTVLAVAVAAGAWLAMRDEGFGLRPGGELEATLDGRDPVADVPVLSLPPDTNGKRGEPPG